MVEALPWMLCTFTVLAVLLITVVQGCARREQEPTPANINRALSRRKKARAQAAADLERIAGALESSNAEELLADEVNDLETGS